MSCVVLSWCWSEENSDIIPTSVWICRCGLRWSLVSPRWGAHPADLRSTEDTHQVRQLAHTPTHFSWLTEVCGWCHLPLVFQWFLNATMTTWWRSTSRGAWDWTTRRLAPSSPSASLLMTTLLRLWVTSGSRSNPNHPPVLQHLPAARVSHTPQHTATAKVSPTRKPPAGRHQTAATGLSIKPGRNKENVDFVTLNISRQICVLSNEKSKQK